MASDLSPQNEQYIQQALAGGLFPTREALLDRAVETFRLNTNDEPRRMIPPEHEALVQEGLDQLKAGQVIEMTEEEWQRLEDDAIELARQDCEQAQR